MGKRLHRSIDHPVRKNLDRKEQWDGPDRGLIWCWELGRALGEADLDMAQRSTAGELVTLPWKKGSLQYLAQWQGLRHENLDLGLDEELTITCSKTRKPHIFKSGKISDGQPEQEVA